MDEPFCWRWTNGPRMLAMGTACVWLETGKTVVFVTHSLTEAVYLADEVVVMSARPGRIVDWIDVDLPRPRGAERPSLRLNFVCRTGSQRHIRAEHA